MANGKFTYGDQEYDVNDLALYLHDNANNWVAHNGITGKDAEATAASISDMIGRIQSGDIDNLQYDGIVKSHSGLFNDNDRDKHFLGIKTGHTTNTNGIAAEFLNLAMTNLKSTSLKEDASKEKLDSATRLRKAFSNKYFGGNDPGDNLDAVWTILDKEDESGNRGRNNRLLAYGQLLNDAAADTGLDTLDYTGSAFKDAETYRTALRNAANYANNGDYDNFIKAYAAAGGDMTDADKLFGIKKKEEEPKEKTALELELEAYLKELEASGGHDAATIAKMVEAKRLKLLLQYKKEELLVLENDDWNTYYNGLDDGYTGGKYQFTAWTDNDADKWYGWHGNLAPLDEQERKDAESRGLLNNGQGAALMDNAWNAFLGGQALSETLKDAIRAKLHYDDLNDTKTYERLNNDTYLIKPTEKNGTAWVWNDKTKTLSQISAKAGSTYMKSRLKKSWQKKRYAAYSKEGGKLDLLLVLKALSGAEIVARLKQRGLKAYNDAINAEAKATGKTADQVKVGHADALSSKLHLADQGIQGGLNNSDITRLITAGVDLASIPVSYIPVGGNAAAGIMGLGTTVADLWADATDDSVSSSQMWLNLGANAAMTGLSVIGGGIAKGSKVAKTIVKLLPTALAAYGAKDMLNDPSFQKSFTKLKNADFKHFTTNDVKNIGAAIKLISVGHNATKSAAGSIGVDMATARPKVLANTINKTGRGLASWGNNASAVSKYAAKVNDKLPGLKNLKMTDRYNIAKALNEAVINAGGFRSGEVIPMQESNGKVKIGGQEVEKETAIAMQKAFKLASSKPKATAESIKSAIMKAYLESAEGKSGHVEAVAEKLATAFTGDAMAIGNQFKVAANPEGKFNINGQLLDATLKQKYIDLYNNTAGDDAAKLTALNNAWQLEFKTPAVPESWKLTENDFNFGDLKGNKGWWDLRRIGGRGNLNTTDDNPGFVSRTYRKINPERANMFDTSTENGLHNAKILRLLRVLQGDNINESSTKLANDVEYNAGLGDWFGFQRDITSEMKGVDAAYLKEREAKQKAAHEQALANKPTLTRDSKALILKELRQNEDSIVDRLKYYKKKKGLKGSLTDILMAAKKEAKDTNRSLKAVLRRSKDPVIQTKSVIPKVSKMNTTSTMNGNTATRLSTSRFEDMNGNPLSKRETLTKEALLVLKSKGVDLKNPNHKVDVKAVNSPNFFRKLLGITDTDEVRLVYRSPSTGEYFWWKKGGKIVELKALRQGGTINKYQPGGNMYPSNFTIPTKDDNNSWWWGRWKQQNLNGLNANAQVGNLTLLHNADHNKDFSLGMAYAKNDAYTGLSGLVGKDIQNYIDTDSTNYSSLQDLVNGYNTNINTLNSFWAKDGYTANTSNADYARHNDLFKRMYASRSDNSSNNNALIGWQEDGVAGKNYMGTSTWMRRADLYRDKFANLKDDNEIRNRLHQVKLRNGQTGYVYKEDNGTIGIADDALLTRLGLNGTPQNPDLQPETQPQELLSGGAQRFLPRLKTNPLKGLSRAASSLLTDLPWNKYANLLDSSRTNKLLLDIANKETTYLLKLTPITDPVEGDYKALLSSYGQAAKLESAGNNQAKNTTDALQAAAIKLLYADKANEYRELGDLAYNKRILLTEDALRQDIEKNVAKFDEDSIANAGRLTALLNSKLTNKSGYLTQLNANRTQFRNDIKNWMDTKLLNKRNFLAKAAAKLMEAKQQATLQPYKDKMQALYDKNASQEELNAARREYQKAAINFSGQEMRNYFNQLALINGIDGFDFGDYSTATPTFTWTLMRLKAEKGGILEQMVSLKKGGSTSKKKDLGDREARAKDLDRHEKNRQHHADLTEKKLDRLARLKGKYVDRYTK